MKRIRIIPVILYAWICLGCKETGKGRAPQRCPVCKSVMVKEIQTEVNTREVI